MTKTLEAGPELDARVAVEVMGRQVRYIDSEEFVCEKNAEAPLGFVCNFGGAIFTNDREWLIDGWLDVELNREVARSSTDWAAAREVLEHQSKQERCHFSLQRFTASIGTEHEWRADFGFNTAHASTAPLAICLAALEAVK